LQEARRFSEASFSPRFGPQKLQKAREEAARHIGCEMIPDDPLKDGPDVAYGTRLRVTRI